ncbi:MAG: toll/interleukin-1 receptor domain-containing protein [Candidatus Omnitrophota bacterium]
MSSISKTYRGFADQPLSSQQLLDLFDKLWGESARGFPRYPQVIGSISGYWRSADGVEHNVSNLNEILSAYEQKLTSAIQITGKINGNPRCLVDYIPSEAKVRFTIMAENEEIADRYIGYVKEMFPNKKNPIVFVSYARDELALADFVKKILIRFSENKLDVFVATRDIPPGDNPLRVMMEEKLKSAQAIIPICSQLAKVSSWVWWESASVWGRGYKVYPLCTNISLGDFGAPMSLVTQGKDLFVKDEFENVLKQVCSQFSITCSKTLTNSELEEYEKLKNEYSKKETSAKILVDYKKLEMTQDFHKYSFIFEVENRTQKKFDDIIVELYFPEDYIEEKKWDYPHLKSFLPEEKPGYICLVFSFSGLPERAKSLYMNCLLPGKKLKVFGEDAITKLHYDMDHERWDKRFRYEVQWKVYVNGGAPQEGSIPLNSIQYF